ncbi:MAG: glycoside hydrolase family 48 protein, partial [Lachnospiraceae bacterium]
MKKRFLGKRFVGVCLTTAMAVTQTLSTVPVYAANQNQTGEQANEEAPTGAAVTNKDRCNELYDIITDPKTGYYDKNGIPYHSIEKLMIEAPDYGHESTSEAASYDVWLKAIHGKMTGDYSGIDKSWKMINNYFIPTDADQPSGGYNASSPATYADEYEVPSKYPSKLGGQSGQDPLYQELKSSYNTDTMYGMHWLVDVDNFFGFGKRGNVEDKSAVPVYINTFQRGKMEGCWNTIPQPSWEIYQAGIPGMGYLPYFTTEASGPSAKQWRYTIASDADARVVQAMYRAKEWAKEDGKTLSAESISNTAKLGDYLRYSMYDKYFRKVGDGKQTAQGKDSCMYLLSWYYAWGGDINGQWSWRIGSSHSHFGYQNPFAAWVLSEDSTGFVPKSSTAQTDWEKSYDTQLDFYQWLQSAEGGIAGGATNSWNGRYEDIPSNVSTFHGMAYQEHPVYSNPGSNQWFGMQCWSMQRIAEVYYETGNKKAKALMDKWVEWVESILHMNSDDEYLPSNLDWEGQPDTWTGEYTGNPNLHVKVRDYGHDVGCSASLANTLAYYAAAQKKYDKDADYQKHVDVAQQLLDKIWTYRDEKGIGDVSKWDKDKIDLFYAPYEESADGTVVKGVYVPDNLANGKMPYGDAIAPGSSFYDLRKNAFAAEVKREKAAGTDKEDGSLTYCMEKLENKEEFSITYHRFWANAEAAIAYGVMADLFPESDGSDTPSTPSTDKPSSGSNETSNGSQSGSNNHEGSNGSQSGSNNHEGSNGSQSGSSNHEGSNG